MNSHDRDNNRYRLYGQSVSDQEERVRTEPAVRPPQLKDQRQDRAQWRQRQRGSAAGTHQQQLPSSSPPPPSKRPQMVLVPDDRSLMGTIATHGYQLGETIGYGSYSKVRAAIRLVLDDDAERATAHRVACKVIDKRRESVGVAVPPSTYVRKFLPRELDVLRAVRHPHVVRTHGIYVAPSTVLVFMDYCAMGDLLDYMQRVKSMPQWQVHMFLKQICDAVDYLHRNDIAHRDIKCENVLLENPQHVKLTDFGFARICTDERGRRIMSQTYCGSMMYAAPEVLQGMPYDPKASDVWALGVVLYVMLADCMPYPQNNRQQIVANQIIKKLNKPKKSITREALALVTSILEPDVTKRATVYQVRRHPWVIQSNPYQYILNH